MSDEVWPSGRRYGPAGSPIAAYGEIEFRFRYTSFVGNPADGSAVAEGAIIWDLPGYGGQAAIVATVRFDPAGVPVEFALRPESVTGSL